MLKNTNLTYGSVSKFFHWTIFILVAIMLTVGFFLSDIPDDYQALAYNLHKLTGITILLLMILRGAWALMNVKPSGEMALWQQWAERFVHYSLYAALIAMPLVGWIGSVAAGRPPHLGNIILSLPIAANDALVSICFQIHKLLAFFIIALVTVHVAAALYHYFIKRDNMLQRMM
jgi:cytochrome b561